MPDQTRYYIIGAFLLGIALTAAYNKQSSNLAEPSENNDRNMQLKQQQKLIAKFSKINDLDTLKKSLVEFESLLKEGIEGCIGDTPLIKIKSLSEYTGCEILAKAEVCL
jgi:cysteine synthase A